MPIYFLWEAVGRGGEDWKRGGEGEEGKKGRAGEWEGRGRIEGGEAGKGEDRVATKINKRLEIC